MKIKTQIFENFDNIPKKGDILSLSEKNIHHLKNVLRAKAGDFIKIIINESFLSICEIVDIKKENIFCKINEIESLGNQTKNKIIVCFAICKPSQNELVAQKLTELGVNEIVFWESDFEAFKVKDKDAKLQRLNKIIEGASRQSKQVFIPKCFLKSGINETLSFIKSEHENATLLYGAIDNNAKRMREIQPFSGDIVIFIGPEGGFSKKEEEILKKETIGVTFCNSVLKAETGAIVAISQIMAFLV